MEFELDIYSEDYGIYENPNTPEDIAYRDKLLKISEEYPITKIRLAPDFEEDYEYIYFFETEKNIDCLKIMKIQEELNKKMRSYRDQLGIKRMKYVILSED